MTEQRLLAGLLDAVLGGSGAQPLDERWGTLDFAPPPVVWLEQLDAEIWGQLPLLGIGLRPMDSS